MYVFGDSTLDVGNNNFLLGLSVPRASIPYYGIDFPGLLVSTALETGVNYASGGAGILDTTNSQQQIIPLSWQLQHFKDTKAKMVAAAVGSAAPPVDALLARSVFLISVGNNDIYGLASAIFSNLISNYSATITELYAMGARKLAIINVGLIGCIPAARLSQPLGACDAGKNQLAAGFNVELRSLLAALAARLPGLVYSLADSYGLTKDILDDPQASGFTDIASACLTTTTVCPTRFERDHHFQKGPQNFNEIDTYYIDGNFMKTPSTQVLPQLVNMCTSAMFMPYKLAMEGFVLLCLVIVISMDVLGAAAVSDVLQPPPMFVFGDSTLDVGNNFLLPGLSVPMYYGIDLPGVPAGRYSNGFNVADFIGRQVQYFKDTKAKMVAAVGSAAAVDALLARSVFLISTGNNDLAGFSALEAKLNKSPAQQQSDAATFLPYLISNYSANITELYAMGARKFAIVNAALIGCVPAARVLSQPLDSCIEGLNLLAGGFNVGLGSLLATDLAARLPGFVYSLADSFVLLKDLVDDPPAWGFTDVASACCGDGFLLAQSFCMPTAKVCPTRAERDHHVFWDLFHFSQRACFLTAQAFYDGPSKYTTPINFMQLAAQST
ncbi:hypothetical protein HU200_043365 [Digitaria exilis]|uniref:GDSL esterase/lipase n=1 Tax=Digitaria exilis TaxID=1010633 RepID=A0A835B0S5_9POAL|nr:hypothetical protein HU200_043365 [Digitaria exilis]